MTNKHTATAIALTLIVVMSVGGWFASVGTPTASAQSDTVTSEVAVCGANEVASITAEGLVCICVFGGDVGTCEAAPDTGTTGVAMSPVVRVSTSSVYQAVPHHVLSISSITPSSIGAVAPPPTCTGANKALQWSGTAWSCYTFPAGTPSPSQTPPPSETPPICTPVDCEWSAKTYSSKRCSGLDVVQDWTRYKIRATCGGRSCRGNSSGTRTVETCTGYLARCSGAVCSCTRRDAVCEESSYRPPSNVCRYGDIYLQTITIVRATTPASCGGSDCDAGFNGLFFEYDFVEECTDGCHRSACR